MDPLSLLTGGLIDSVIGGLKSLGIVKDPEKELKLRESLSRDLESKQDFFLSYFTATIGKDEPWYSPSKLFRPLCSFAIVVFYIAARITGMEFTPTDQTILFGVVGFWFGGRTLEKIIKRR